LDSKLEGSTTVIYTVTWRNPMIRDKHGAVIGWETRVSVCASSEFPGHGIFPANRRAVFLHDHQTTEYRQI